LEQNVLISNAYAQAAGAAADPFSGFIGMVPLLLMFIVVWFLMIRPQMKKAKEHTKMVSELQKGDEVVTQGGLAGKIAKVGESYLTLDIADTKDGAVEVAVQKSAVAAILPKGTLKTL
jgi:preprotein translocase subunit YajC